MNRQKKIIIEIEIHSIQMAEKPLYPDLQPSAPVFNQNTSEVLFILNDTEPVNMPDSDEFIRRLTSSSNDLPVKCVSIIGKPSATINHLFFQGRDRFTRLESCSFGAWTSLADNQRTLVFDVQGQLNDNQARIRVLLKVMCLSDIVIYQTNAPKLNDEFFRVISEISNAFERNFQKEFENIETRPSLVILHETELGEILKDNPKFHLTAVEQLRKGFEKRGLSYSAFQSIQYVGVQTTENRELKNLVNEKLYDNSLRSPRKLSVIFKALQNLNDKFHHTIPLETPSILPEEFFTCTVRCLGCDGSCTLPSSHVRENQPHHCRYPMCIYNKQLDNEIMKCTKCDREGLQTTVVGKVVARGDGLVHGLVRYVWSGFVIECPNHGEIYRSRKFWYGNTAPNDVTRSEVVHAWPGDQTSRIPSDITARRFVEALRAASGYISATAVPIKEKLADQLAPNYWVPNSEMNDCYSCKLVFGTEYPKHHCRACGYIFCDSCTSHRAIIPALNSTTPERVCHDCYEQILPVKTLTFQNDEPSEDNPPQPQEFDANQNTYTIPMSRRILELVQNNINYVAYEYPKTWINEGMRPNYWRADDECKVCCVCQHPFNTTTHRLHHCRRCGDGVCDQCSTGRLPVPERDWLTPERVCTTCESVLKQ